MPASTASRPGSAKLRFVSPDSPGLTRRKRGKGFCYYTANGALIRDPRLIARIRKLAIPPAWRDVWICPDPRGHLQAVGRDERGRRQYRYHDAWRPRRDRSKYAQALEFGKSLPRIRRKVARDLRHPVLDRTRVAAAVVRLMDVAYVRVGNAAYAKENNSYGATTLQTRHALLDGRAVRLRFTAKGGKMVRHKITDRQLVRTVRRCHELPGQMLFCYRDQSGEVRPVSSDEVNDYIREAAGGPFTAKDFRTWAASVLAFERTAELLRRQAEDGKDRRKIPLKKVIAPVADDLGNTPAICRKSYIHPDVLETVKEGRADPGDFLAWPPPTKHLSAGERALMRFLAKKKKPHP
jgi:DNA topoisomerase-1